MISKMESTAMLATALGVSLFIIAMEIENARSLDGRIIREISVLARILENRLVETRTDIAAVAVREGVTPGSGES